MKRGSKYWQLYLYLQQQYPNDVTLTFGEIETMINARLPKTARSSRAWWSNRSSGAIQAQAWTAARYTMAEVDLAQEVVTFRKLIPDYTIEVKDGTVAWEGNSIKALRLHLEMSQTQMADEMGVRQQTISDWENSTYTPTKAMRKYLTMIAEQAGFFKVEE